MGHKKEYALLRSAAATKLRLEFLDAPGGIDEALLARIRGMRIGGNIADHDLVLHSVDFLGLATAHRRAGKELVSGGNVDEGDRIELGMDFSFHGYSYSLINPDAL